MTVTDILPIGSGEYKDLFFVLFPNTQVSEVVLQACHLLIRNVTIHILQQCLPGHVSCPLMEDHINID